MDGYPVCLAGPRPFINFCPQHCNPHVCFDVISISSVSFGLLAVGNPIGIGVVTVSSFIGVGILPIAPISLGLVPIGIIARGYQILNPFAQKY